MKLTASTSIPCSCISFTTSIESSPPKRGEAFFSCIQIPQLEPFLVSSDDSNCCFYVYSEAVTR